METSQKSKQKICQLLILSQGEALAKTCQLLEKVLDSMEKEVYYSFTSSDSLKKSNLLILSGKMLKELLALKEAGTLQECKLKWNKLGMMSTGKLSMPKISEYHKTESVSLQSVLEKEVDEKYYLSKLAVAKIIRHGNKSVQQFMQDTTNKEEETNNMSRNKL